MAPRLQPGRGVNDRGESAREDLEAAEDAFLGEPGVIDTIEPLAPPPVETDVTKVIEDDAGEPWMPPTDPVLRPGKNGDPEVLGGFAATSMDDLRPEGRGDEAIADAVRRELAEDAATTDLDVEVEVVDGTVYLRGTVSGPEDVDSAEEVAGRVPGVVEVVEQLDVPGL